MSHQARCCLGWHDPCIKIEAGKSRSCVEPIKMIPSSVRNGAYAITLERGLGCAVYDLKANEKHCLSSPDPETGGVVTVRKCDRGAYPGFVFRSAAPSGIAPGPPASHLVQIHQSQGM